VRSLLKPVVVGVLGAVLAAVAYVALVVLVATWQQGVFAGEGVGGFAIVVSVIPVFGVALAGFVIAFVWTKRRLRRKAIP
jgi:hypothetical protein